MSDPLSGHYILVHKTTETPLGRATRIHVERMDGAPMPWREVYDVFERAYSGKWAIQVFPPKEKLMDGANKYHLLVFDTVIPDWAEL